jgi:hypothetical protein
MKGKFEFEGKKDPVLEKILEQIDVSPKLYFGDDYEDIRPEEMRFVVRHLNQNNYDIRTKPTGFAQCADGYHCQDNDPKIIDRYSWPVGLRITYLEEDKKYVLTFMHRE